MLENLKKNNSLKVAVNLSAIILFSLGLLCTTKILAQEVTPNIPEEEEIVTEEPKGEEWEQVECNTEGCRYRHRVTGKVLFLLKKVVQTPGKVLGIAPKSSSSQPPVAKFHSEDSSETTDDTKKLHYSFTTFKEMTDSFLKAKENGAKFIIIQLGNLEGCPPCQAVNSAIKQRLLSKRSDIAVLDFNAFQNRESDAIEYFYTKLSSNYRIHRGFSFPQIYVMYLDDNTGWWNFKLTINGQSNSVDTVMKSIEQVVNRSVESLSDETKQQGLAH